MHQYNIPILHIFQDALHDFLPVLELPVQRVNGPQNGGHIHLALQIIIPVPVRRTQVLGPLPGNLLDHHAGLVHRVADGIFPGLGQLNVAVAMIADQMALVLHAAHQVLVSGDALPHQEKGRFDSAGLQSVQQVLGALLVGPVVKGQRHALDPVSALFAHNAVSRPCIGRQACIRWLARIRWLACIC